MSRTIKYEIDEKNYITIEKMHRKKIFEQKQNSKKVYQIKLKSDPAIWEIKRPNVSKQVSSWIAKLAWNKSEH